MCSPSLGDSVTTDHISPAGAIKADTPAGKYLTEHGVERRDFNSDGSRRGNHEVMIRYTFANIRLRNHGAGHGPAGYTPHFTVEGAPVAFIYDASRNGIQQGTPLVILAGKAVRLRLVRDWAAKGTALLCVKAVIAESYERIHRSNLIGMGATCALSSPEGATAETLGLTGEETFSFTRVEEANNGTTPRTVKVTTHTGVEFDAVVRIDTPGEADYYRNGGIMQYALRNRLQRRSGTAAGPHSSSEGCGPSHATDARALHPAALRRPHPQLERLAAPSRSCRSLTRRRSVRRLTPR